MLFYLLNNLSRQQVVEVVLQIAYPCLELTLGVIFEEFDVAYHLNFSSKCISSNFSHLNLCFT